MYKDNLVAALQKAHQAGKCKGRIIVVEDSDNMRGFDGCMKLALNILILSIFYISVDLSTNYFAHFSGC